MGLEGNRKIKLVIVSPNKDVYSETFIQAHKNIPDCEVHFLYGGLIPTHSEKSGHLGIKPSLIKRILHKITNNKIPNPFELGFETYLTKNKIDVVLAEYGMTGAKVCPICKKLKIPLLVHFHGYDAHNNIILSQYTNKYRSMFNYASKVFVVSKVMKEQIAYLGCEENKIILNIYGPDNRFLEVNRKLDNKKKFLSVGRYVAKKAPYYTILAFKTVIDKHPDAELLMAGNGELYEICKNLVNYYKLNNSIKFLGVITKEEYIGLLETSMGYIQHSIKAENGDMEGTPVSILEACAAGVPVVSTKHAGIQEIIKNGETGFLVDEHDVNGMAEKIIEIIENDDVRRRLGKMCKENIQKHYTMRHHLNCLRTQINLTLKIE